MILGTSRFLALGALLSGLAAPALAGTPREPVEAVAPSGAAPADQRTQTRHSRRVELPFLLDFRAPEDESPKTAPREDGAPHPFREILPKRASLSMPGTDALAIRARRLSRFGEFG